VPASGQWESDNVFAIPLSPNDATSFSSPGVIIFECTPLEGVTDELERYSYLPISPAAYLQLECRKFRILEDCARLRSVVKALPRARHFIVSLLVLFWATDKNIEAPSDLVSMVRCPS
jgi:hypothetical protein